MAKELKIVMAGPSSSDTQVYLDGDRVGLIQEIRFYASTENLSPKVEIVFPNLFSWEVSATYYKTSDLPSQLASTIASLSEVPNVKITLKSLW